MRPIAYEINVFSFVKLRSKCNKILHYDIFFPENLFTRLGYFWVVTLFVGYSIV